MSLPSSNIIYLVTSGDSRLAANQMGWPAQKDMEDRLNIKRAHDYNNIEKHGFINSQRMGLDVFLSIPQNSPVLVGISVWQYSYFLVPGLLKHKGPILTVGNWSGQWPGLVGLLNLNGSLTRMGRNYSSIWSVDFSDSWFKTKLQEWLTSFNIIHDLSHVHEFPIDSLSKNDVKIGQELAKNLLEKSAIIGIFDEGCMGMINALFPDDLLWRHGFFKERLSQSALLAEMQLVKNEEASAIYQWLKDQGMTFKLGPNESTDLTENQILQQCQMYIAAIRIAYQFQCDVIGIQYQQGLKDMCVASDLAEGMMNNLLRPPVYHRETKEELFTGEPVVHFNEVDQGCAVDSIITNRVWKALNLDPSTTLHDVRWGEFYPLPQSKESQYIWVFEISGSVPPNHFSKGYKEAIGERQPPMYFPKGGSTIKGICKPGKFVWSRVYIENHQLHCDMGTGTVVSLPLVETERRWSMTTSQWPIMHAVLDGVTRDQFMAKHKSNHIQVAYVPDDRVNQAIIVKGSMIHALGINVHLCGNVTF